MDYIFKKVIIVDPRSPCHLKKRDVWIKNGIIHEIKANIVPNKNSIILDVAGSFLSPGWVDIGVHTGEPGFEERETLISLSNASVAGGYTTICCLSNTNPVLHSKSEIHFILHNSHSLPIHIWPIGAISKDNASVEMAEILQMFQSGAVAFSDGNQSIQKSGLLLRALEYLKLLPKSLIINQSLDDNLWIKGQIHEGLVSTKLGLKGIPSIAEYIAVQRDIEILRYAQSRLLIHKISTSESVQLIRNAKLTLKDLFASVSIFNLAFEENSLEQFNHQLKLNPPIRSKKDREALINGLIDGSIDIICSDHTPMNPEKKELEFQSSAFGAISLETAYSLIQTFLNNEIDASLWVEKVAINPRKILNKEIVSLQENAVAELTWFHPDINWNYSDGFIKSISKNSPLKNSNLKGKILGVYNKNKFVSNII